MRADNYQSMRDVQKKILHRVVISVCSLLVGNHSLKITFNSLLSTSNDYVISIMRGRLRSYYYLSAECMKCLPCEGRPVMIVFDVLSLVASLNNLCIFISSNKDLSPSMYCPLCLPLSDSIDGIYLQWPPTHIPLSLSILKDIDSC